MLFQFDADNFRGGQGFRIPRDDVYNVTIAGAAGGRGLCNIQFGRGVRYKFQVRLTVDDELLVMVGQKGKSPCDNIPQHPLCWYPPISLESAAQCNHSWYENKTNITSFLYNFEGGGGGGGASLLGARAVESGELQINPIVVVGGGGGSSAILAYETAANLIINRTYEPTNSPEKLNQYHLDARSFRFTDVVGGENYTRGFRPLSQRSVVAGAGGGWLSLLSSTDTDGKSISQSQNFAEGGFDCLRNIGPFREVDGGFGGGGGECGAGGGGGGFTGGSVLAVDNIVPGGGGHSVAFSYQNIPILTPLRYSLNSKDGYVDIVPANCNCTGYCAVNETDDTFECFCQNNTHLAQDRFDCFQGKEVHH